MTFLQWHHQWICNVRNFAFLSLSLVYRKKLILYSFNWLSFSSLLRLVQMKTNVHTINMLAYIMFILDRLFSASVHAGCAIMMNRTTAFKVVLLGEGSVGKVHNDHSFIPISSSFLDIARSSLHRECVQRQASRNRSSNTFLRRRLIIIIIIIFARRRSERRN